MSTKNIRECLLLLKKDMPVSPLAEQMADRALADLDAIEAAARHVSIAGISGWREGRYMESDHAVAQMVLDAVAKDKG